MTDTQWRRVSPLSVLFYLAQLARSAVRQIVQLAVPAAAVMASTGGFTMGRLFGFGVFVLLLAGSIAVARYATFRYCVGERSIVIRSGVLRKHQLNIHYDRIQAINDSQNPVYRLFNLVNLQLDTPGTAQSEAHLPAVSPTVAADLRRRVQAAGSRGRGDGRKAEADETEYVIHALALPDMLRIGLSSRTILVVFAVVPWLWNTVGERLASTNTPQRLFAQLTDALESATGLDSVGSAAVAALALVLMLVSLSIGAAMLRFNGYRLVRNQGNFTSRAGLLTVRSHAVATRKIQCITLRQSMMLGLFSGVRVTAFPAASYQQEGGPFMVPFASRQQAPALARQLWGNDCRELSFMPGAGSYHRVHGRYKTYLFVRHGLVPVGVLGALFLASDFTTPQLLAAAALGSLWLLAVAIGAALKYRRLGIQVGGNAIAVKGGLAGWYIDTFPIRKVQSLEIRQSLLQRRRGLASLRLFLASRTIVIPYISVAWAKALAQQVLGTIAEDRAPWI